MPLLAFWMPGPWEIIILGTCCLGVLAVTVAVVVLVIVLIKRQSKSPPGDPPKPE